MPLPSFRRVLAPLLLGAALLALGGCTTVGGAAPPRSALAVAPYRAALELSGRIAINYSHDGQNVSLSGQFTWQQSAQQTEVRLISPTGQTMAVILVTPLEATLTQSGKAPRSAADLDSLMRQALGWSLPVSGLRAWLQGHASDADGQPFAASPARDSVVTRDGWKLDYLSWQDNPAALPQPKRIDLTRLTHGDVDDMAIRIVLDPTVTE